MISLDPFRPSVRVRSRTSVPPALAVAVGLLAWLPCAAAAGQTTRVSDAGPAAPPGAIPAAAMGEAQPWARTDTQAPPPRAPRAHEPMLRVRWGGFNQVVAVAAAPRAHEPILRVRAAGMVGLINFAAADTFRALYGSSTGLTLGGAVQVVHRQGWFGQVDVSRYHATGERVFVSGTDRFPLGIASRVSVTPIEVTAGYRLARRPGAPGGPPVSPPGRRGAAPRRPSRFASLVPYGGAGVGAVRLTERADFAEAGDDVEETHRSYHVVGGIEIPVRGWLAAGVEAGYRWVPDALGSGGVSKEFGETDLGGSVLRVKVIVGR
jgi:hypothetical protein